MNYLRWHKKEAAGLENPGLSHVVTECAPDGSVLGEAGFDDSGKPVHRAPDPLAKLSLFDHQVVAMPAHPIACVSVEEFFIAWQEAGLPLTIHSSTTRFAGPLSAGVRHRNRNDRVV